jgi:hypothetical protein
MREQLRRCFGSALCGLVVWTTGIVTAGEPLPPPDALEATFRVPTDAVKPWAYWWWIKGNVTESSITRDLEQMKQKGFTGLLMFDARGYHEDHLPPPLARMEFMSSEWRRMLRFGMKEAARLGLTMSVNLSSCAGALRGPWDVGDDAPKRLVWASQQIVGGKRWDGELPHGTWGRSWEIALLAARQDTPDADRKTATPPVVEVIDLTDRVSAGRLTWDAPPGRWTLLRFAQTVIEGHEHDVDILDAPAVTRYFDRMGRALLDDAGPLAGKTLTHFYSVSWEGATPTWTRDFEQHFQRYRGYALRPYLPVLAGMTVRSREISERFVRDYHKTLGECFRDHCYGTLRDLCHAAGLQWHSESGGPWDRKIPSFQHADQLAFLGRNDMPQGEFWYPERGLNRPIAMAAHLYGRPLAAAEAFTHMRPHWSVYPAILKPCADAAFCDGINHLVWHTFTASPPEFGKPGIEYFAGSHLNPNVTWFEQSGAFLTYLARCQCLLRQGRPVCDVLCYTGDRPYLHWGRGKKWTENATLNLPPGYTYDLVNTDVLLERLAVKDGRLVLPEGMSYRLLVVDLEDETAPLPALRKITELARAGATVVLGRRRPQRTAGLSDYPACDDQVRQLGAELWGPSDAPSGAHAVGQGQWVRGLTLEDALRSAAVLPDVVGPWEYAHRQDQDANFYFLAGTGAAGVTFRVRGQEPELWDPVTGRIHDAVAWRETADGRTVVPLTLPENGSVFVVFRRPAESRRLVSVTAPDDGLEIEGRGPNRLRLRLWRAGRYALTTAGTQAVVIDVQQVPAAQALDGPWEVKFAPGWGAPATAVFERLVSWTDHPDAGIKYFSGTATYRKSIDLTHRQTLEPVRLELGAAKHIAQVRLNGQTLGVVWTAPWRVDLTGLVKPGRNELEIDVTNVWVNRLIGDAGLPEEKRLTKTHARRPPGDTSRLAHLKGYKADDPLLPSGLLGPVRLEFGVRVERELP